MTVCKSEYHPNMRLQYFQTLAELSSIIIETAQKLRLNQKAKHLIRTGPYDKQMLLLFFFFFFFFFFLLLFFLSVCFIH